MCGANNFIQHLIYVIAIQLVNLHFDGNKAE